MKRWGSISRLVQSWPGRETFGPYRFMPFFFLAGAVLEFAMIRWTPGGNTNFWFLAAVVSRIPANIIRWEFSLNVVRRHLLNVLEIRHTSGGKPRTSSLLSWLVQLSLADLLRNSVLAAKSGRTGMPYGYSWPAYLRFAGAAMLSMFAGAQCVHQLYRPLDDLGVYIEEEKKALESSKLGQGQPSDTQQSKHEVKGS